MEQEKTRLLSQNCQLKRLLDQNDNTAAAGEIQTTNKKRKFDNVIQMQTISDSSDEGLGSMSPEPVTIFTVLHKNNQQQTGIAPIKDIAEMKHQLEIERRSRINAEEQLRQLECQIYPERIRDVPIHYQHQEVIEHTNNVRDEEMELSIIPDTLPNHHLVLHDENIAHNQVVICSTDIDNDDDETEDCCDEDDEELRPESPISTLQQQHPIDIKDEIQQQQQNCEIVQLQKRPVTPQQITQLSPPTNQRLQPILEAAIKAEPKVEVERINSPVKTNDETSATQTTTTDKTSKNQSRMFVTTSRQNLETIVEAIRHLEGDHLFGEVAEPTQEAPLALTNKPPQITRQLQFEMNPFLQFRNSNPAATNQLALTSTQTAISHHQLQQQRPGVIVVKQNS